MVIDLLIFSCFISSALITVRVLIRLHLQFEIDISQTINQSRIKEQEFHLSFVRLAINQSINLSVVAESIKRVVTMQINQSRIRLIR